MTTERPTFGQAYSHGNVDSLFQAESHADELKRGYQAAIEAGIQGASKAQLFAPGFGDTPYWRGAKCAVEAIKALSQEGAQVGIKVTIVAGNSAETYIDKRGRGTLEYEVNRFLLSSGQVWIYEDVENDLKVYVPRGSVRAMYVSNKEV